MTSTAPIALFVYNRADHTRRTVDALRRNTLAASSDLVVFSDGAKSPQAEQAVAAVRDYLRRIDGFRTVSIRERPRNAGLARSITEGVTELCASHGKVIVLEDDLVTSPPFLQFMNDALETYADDERVASVHGYWYPVTRPVPAQFFLRTPSSWGWATWARAWRHFEANGRKLLAQLRERGLTRAFDLDGSMAYTGMLEDQIAGRNDSWAIRWDASVFLAGKLALYPGTSFVHNIGFDGSGTHSPKSGAFEAPLQQGQVNVQRLVEGESAAARAALIDYYLRQRSSLPRRLLGRALRFVRQHSSAKPATDGR